MTDHTCTQSTQQNPCSMVCNPLFVEIGCSGLSKPLHTSQTSIKGKAKFNYCAGDCRKTTLSKHTQRHTHRHKIKWQLTLVVDSFIVSGYTPPFTQSKLDTCFPFCKVVLVLSCWHCKTENKYCDISLHNKGVKLFLALLSFIIL